MITHKMTQDGYEFYLENSLVAVGSHTSKGFEMCDSDDNVTVHGNGMMALRFLKEKHLGFKFEPITSIIPLSQSKPANEIFVKHIALQGVKTIVYRR